VADFRALLVDDEKELGSALAERLGYRGIDAEFVTGGRDALEKLQNSPFDVIVIDLKLPGMSGEELVREVNKSYPDLPVLMITGHGMGADGDFEKPRGVYDLLPKPIDIAELVRKMREAIEAK
jgi:DNA-binding NtrC family response regulator